MRWGQGLGESLERALGAAALMAYRRPVAALLLCALATAIAVPGLQRLRVDADLTRLLPESFSSVEAVEELKTRFGGVGYVALFATGDDPEGLRRFADDVSTRLENLESVRWVDHQRQDAFFADRALYWVDLEDLQDIEERIEERRQWEHLHRNPFYVDLDETGPPSLDFSDLEAEYGQRTGLNLNETRSGGATYYEDVDAHQLVVLVKPTALASDLAFTKRVVADVRGVLDAMDSSAYGPGFGVELTGRYVKRLDGQGAIEGDLGLASLVALLLVLLYVAVHFRRLSAVALVMAPLAVGLVWTYAFAAVAIGTLNILTAFVGAILLGLGIDNGIHLLQRFDTEVGAGSDPERAIGRAFGRTGRASLVAAATTVVALLVIAASQFRGFREFGIVSAAGVALVLGAYLFLLPAMLGALARFGHGHRRAGSPATLPGIDALTRAARPVFWVGIAIVTVLAARSPSAAFEYDFAALDPQSLPSYVLDREVNRIVGRSQTPLVVAASDRTHARAVASAIRERSERLGEASGVDHVLTTADLVPEGQTRKREVLRGIATALGAVDLASQPPNERRRIERVASMAQAEPFGRLDLPESVRRAFEPVSGPPDDEFVLVFPSISLSDGARVIDLAAELRDLPVAAGVRADAAGEAMVLADVLSQVFEEAPRIIALSLALVALALVVLLGGLRNGLLALFPALVTLAVTAGVMALLGVRFNYLNVMVLPVLLGIGVDGGAHMISRLTEGDSFSAAVGQTGRAIAGAVVTTSCGFGALLLAHHPGLQSFGQVALIGLATNLVATVALLPAMLAAFPRLVARPAPVTGPAAGGRLVHGLVTVGYTGHTPLAPGSVGALPAILGAWLLREADWPLWLVVLVPLTLVSVWLVGRYLRGGKNDDPQEVVIDELVGCLIALAFVPWELPWVIAAYLAFRLFDIFKPWPIGAFERKAAGGFGVVGDDVLAGLFAGFILAITRVSMTLV